jgi:hypothetical protein
VSFEPTAQRADRLRAIPLQSVLMAAGADPDRHDKARWHTAQGDLSVTGMKFFNWQQGHGGGGAIDLIMHLKNLGFRTALDWLEDHCSASRQPAQVPGSSPPRLQLPPPQPANLLGVKRYLLHQRHIPASVIEPLIQSGRLYADERGNAVFLLHSTDKSPVGAELRGTTLHSWQGMAPGSRKDHGYFCTLTAQPTAIVLCESAIDALSCFTLFPDQLCISTAGARANPRWLGALIAQSYQIYCGFDADTTGENMARSMISLHPSVKRLRPALHDWNDVLQAQE